MKSAESRNIEITNAYLLEAHAGLGTLVNRELIKFYRNGKMSNKNISIAMPLNYFIVMRKKQNFSRSEVNHDQRRNRVITHKSQQQQ